MTGPRRYENVGGSVYSQPEIQLDEDPNKTGLAQHLRELAPPADSAAGAVWEVWQPTPAPIKERPATLIRIGVAEGLDDHTPPPVCVGGLGERHTALSDSTKAEEAARQMLLRMLGCAKYVRAVVCDMNRTGAFKDFLEPGLCENIFPDQVDEVLAELTHFQHSIATEPGVKPGLPNHPWRILVMTGNPRSGAAKERLRQLTESLNWGSILALGTDIPKNDLVQEGPRRGLRWQLDPQVPTALVRRSVQQMAVSSQPVSPTMTELINGVRERMPSTRGLESHVGTKRDGSVATVCFNDEMAHGLIVGRTGSGKTNFLTYMMADLLHAYDADDLRLFVIDGKKADLSILVAGEGDEAYFPQIRLLGSNVEDPEDGIAILRHIEAEMDRRALMIGDKRAKNIEGLRRITGEKWPRMLVVWDEVQELLDGPLSDEAVEVINRIARQGRQAGIHLVLGTQNWQGVEGIWKKPDLLSQFAIRIALAGGQGMMDTQTNWRIMGEVTGHLAVINKKAGVRHNDADNEIVSTPEVTNNELMAVKYRSFQRWSGWSEGQQPGVLDGRIKPILENMQPFADLKPVANKPARGFVGQKPGIEGEAADFAFEPSPGRNLAILGTLKDEVQQLFKSVGKSIARQHVAGEAKISILYYGDNAEAAAELVSELDKNGHEALMYTASAADAFLTKTASQPNDQPHYILVYGADRVRSTDFKTIVSVGPENQTYVIGSWTGLERLKPVSGAYMSDVNDKFNGIVLLNVTPPDLAAVSRNPSHRTWGGFVRKGRGLFFDMTGNTGDNGLVVKLYK